MSTLATSGLEVRAGGRVLICSLDWAVSPGEFWCVVGRNGAGKSSLLATLSGLMAPAAGTVEIGGESVATLDPMTLARRRGLMTQQIIDSFPCSVFDAAAIGRTPMRMGGAWDDTKDQATINDALMQVGMLERVGEDVTCLSGGERQRVALAALLVQEVPLMLLDEPTSHQDVRHQLGVMRLLQSLSAERAVIATCHDINLAARFATHALLIGEGFHVAGKANEVMTPETLQRTFGCQFSRQGETFIPA